MSSPEDQRAGLERMFQHLEQQQARDAKVDLAVVEYLKKGEIPTDNQAREIINTRVGETRLAILQHHVFWKEKKVREGLEAQYRAAHQAYIDICRHDAALVSLAQGGDYQGHLDYTVSHAAQKDVIAYCALAVGYTNTLRRIQKHREDIKSLIDEALNDAFDSDVTVFIRDLRKNLSHGSVIVVDWQVSYTFPGTSGNMMLRVQNILDMGEWSTRSRQYISEAEDGQINVATTVGEHFTSFRKFHEKLTDIFARNVTDAEHDFYEIDDEHRRWTSQQSAKIFLVSPGKNRDPYDYLHRFFDPNEVREIMRYTKHSKEQVDYMITLKSPDYACDEALRHDLYDMFGVPAEEQ